MCHTLFQLPINAVLNLMLNTAIRIQCVVIKKLTEIMNAISGMLAPRSFIVYV